MKLIELFVSDLLDHRSPLCVHTYSVYLALVYLFPIIYSSFFFFFVTHIDKQNLPGVESIGSKKIYVSP